jgi:hypothetical protein
MGMRVNEIANQESQRTPGMDVLGELAAIRPMAVTFVNDCSGILEAKAAASQAGKDLFAREG